VPPHSGVFQARDVVRRIVPSVPAAAIALDLAGVRDLIPLREAASLAIRRQAGNIIGDFELVLGIPKGALDPFEQSAMGAFLLPIYQSAVHAVHSLKGQILRPRPYHVDPRLTTWFDRSGLPLPGHPSYPSGHATEAFVIAMAVGSLFQQNHLHVQMALFDTAAGIARNREIAGVHFHSDTVAGYALARWVMDKARASIVHRGTFAAARDYLFGAMRLS
jgi:membrane-associated phospholipid phosphatase